MNLFNKSWCVLFAVSVLCVSPRAESADSVSNAADLVSSAIRQQFSVLLAPLTQPPADCKDALLNARFARALEATGDLNGCVARATQCLQENAGQVSGPTAGMDAVLFNGAQCAAGLYHFEEAFRLYDLATGTTYESAPLFAGHVFLFANFAESTQYQSQTKAILSKNARWEPEVTPEFLSNVIYYLSTGDARSSPATDLDRWILGRIADGDPVLKPFLIRSWGNHLTRHVYQFSAAVSFLAAQIGNLDNPHDWFQQAYSTFYQQDSMHFKLAQKLYDAYRPFAHPRVWLPVEENTYDYGELYSTVSKDHLLSGDALKTFQDLKIRWSNGLLASPEALSLVQSMLERYPDAAELLALAGGISDRLGSEDQAMDYFWKSHLASPYYNRAHWGLYRVLYRQRERAFADYPIWLGRVNETVPNLTFSPDLEKYVINWNALEPEAQKRFKYSIRFWAPYISKLHSSGARLYVKSGIQLLSDVPGLEDIRDVRIDYANDNRLWDDVRGLGGQTVVVDYDQMMDGPFGDYNLSGHEITHQFQGESVSESIFPKAQFDCSVALYQAAKRRGVFADPYAGRNYLEYLAQGVGYYMIPGDAPSRFGINSSWIRKNDPDLFSFLNDMQAQSADLSEIRCPVAVTPETPAYRVLGDFFTQKARRTVIPKMNWK